ncbi:ABC transporter substrate-binding protein [Devosia pacifica]|uniref:ABC transporter substrate-binding protein n=1 Tax=Devosia pacifica TaxID=1335967 RepID=A0A918VXF7_9HYPH|nr:ABC transporter substrate-binding protein [Devosia pacifica]GHA32698.1 ABC transporter substrate-binding protein [Devosia pacifica]
MVRLAIAAIVLASSLQLVLAQESKVPEVRVGILEYGTVAWELATVKDYELDAAHDIALEIVPFAGEDATAIALKTGAVDVIVSDWLWVSRMRSEGEDFVLTPYSTSAAALMVPQDSPLEDIEDLTGQRLGVAGGPLDKSWLLLQGLASERFDRDLAEANEISYGAPPLLSEMLKADRLDAVLTFWHYAARLEAEGFRELIGTQDVAYALGAKGNVSMLGYVFRRDWARDNPEAIQGFIAATTAAKQLLASDDDEWRRLQETGVIRDEGETLLALRDSYRDGIPRRGGAQDRQDAALLYEILAQIGGEDLVGGARVFDPETYWGLAGAR